MLSAAVIAAVAGITAFTVPASAQVKPTQVPSAANYTWFEIENSATSGCIQEDGTTSAVYVGGCSSSNSSDLWRWTAARMLLNEHSGLCITSTSDGPGEYMDSCSNNSVQIWGWGAVSPTGPGYLTNNHTGGELAESSDGSLTQVTGEQGDSEWVLP